MSLLKKQKKNSMVVVAENLVFLIPFGQDSLLTYYYKTFIILFPFLSLLHIMFDVFKF